MELNSIFVKRYTQEHWHEKGGLSNTKKRYFLSLQANKVQAI